MKAKNPLEELASRIEEVRGWQPKLDKLAVRKKNPLSESAFCEKRGFHKAAFNRQKKSPETGENIPTPKTVLAVRKAFKAEGV